MTVSEMAARAKEGSYILAALSPETKDRALNARSGRRQNEALAV